MRRVHYAWIVAAVGFVTLITAAGFRSTSGVLIVPLEDEFGWSRATIGLAISINLLCFGLGGPFAAALVERFGLRRVMVGALVAVSAGSSLTVFMTEPWQLCLLWGVVNGLATGAVSVPLAAIIANRWFVARRGLVTGLLTASNATGQLVFLPALAAIVSSYGWRWAAVTVATVAVGVVLPLVALVVRNFPEDVGLLPFGASDKLSQATSGPSNPFALAVDGLRMGMGSTNFWLLTGSFFVCGLSTTGLIQTHLIPAGMDHAMTEVAAASLLAVIGAFDIVGTTLSGWLTDRYDPRVLLFWYYALRGLSLLALPYLFGAPRFGLILFIVFYGLDWVATVPPTVALTAETFGRERVGVVFGWIFSAHQFGAALAAWGAGAARTWFGDYGWAFGTAGLLCLFASGLVIRIGRGGEPIPAPAPA
ncbi:MAG TPA: MFS transporter [Gaiellaceae bacterium]